MSRVDTAVDNKLEEIGSDEAKALEGKAAIANARLAYELFENKFANDGLLSKPRAPRSSVRCGPPPALRTRPIPIASTLTSSLPRSS